MARTTVARAADGARAFQTKQVTYNLLRVLAPPPLPGRVAAAVVLLEPVVEVAAGRVDAVAKKPA